MSSVSNSKARLREEARARRAEADKTASPGVGKAFAQRFFEAVSVPLGAVVAGYARTQAEADPEEILLELKKRGHVVALPSVEGGRQPLVFRVFEADASLVAGPYGIFMPPRSAPSVEPDLIIVPLIAFNRAGHRLGYGVGYYDRTLEALRARKPIITVGIAYAAQEIDSIAPEAHDQRLDWIVTEKETIRVQG